MHSLVTPPSPTSVNVPPETLDVLVIDDENTIRECLVACLHHAGFSCRSAEDGRTALRLLARQRFRLIVTDIHMPDMDGLEVIMHCRRTIPGVQILAISGGGHYLDPTSALHPARLLGSRQTLAKPFAHTAFLAKVLELIQPSQTLATR